MRNRFMKKKNKKIIIIMIILVLLCIYGFGKDNTGELITIPPELIDLLSKAIEQEKEKEVLLPMVHDKEVSYEEVKEYAKNSPDLKANLEELEENPSRNSIFIQTDGDNDGIPDILAEETSGGSLGDCESIFFKGTENGSYRKTFDEWHMTEEFSFIEFEGNNYLVRTSFDYSCKKVDGLYVFLYVDGKQIDSVFLKKTVSNYECKEKDISKQYKSICQNLIQNKEMYVSKLDGRELLIGNAEEGLKDDETMIYHGDYDNDGIKENYRKELFLTSSMNSADYIQLMEEDQNGIVQQIIYEGENAPKQVWLDYSEEGNVVCVMYQINLYEFNIVGYLIKRKQYEEVFTLQFIPKISVQVEHI